MRFRSTWSKTRLCCATFALAAATATAGISGVVAADSNHDDADLFVNRVNQLRTQHGLSALALDPELVAEASKWTATMASDGQLAHSPDITAGISAPWTLLGENVGVHQIHDPDELFQAFVNSPPHYNNLVDPRYQYIGVGVVNTAEGKLWTTQRFMALAPQPTDNVLEGNTVLRINTVLSVHYVIAAEVPSGINPAITLMVSLLTLKHP